MPVPVSLTVPGLATGQLKAGLADIAAVGVPLPQAEAQAPGGGGLYRPVQGRRLMAAGNVLARLFQRRTLLKLCREKKCLGLGADGLSVALLGFAHALNKFDPSRHRKAGNIALARRKARREAELRGLAAA